MEPEKSQWAKWYAKNREKRQAYDRERKRAAYWADPEAARAKVRDRLKRSYDTEKNREKQKTFFDRVGWDKKRAYAKAHYDRNRDKELERGRIYREKTVEVRREKDRQRYLRDVEKQKARSRRYNIENEEKRRAWRIANKEKIAAKSARHEAHYHEKRRTRHHERQTIDPNYRIRRALRSAIGNALKKKGLPRKPRKPDWSVIAKLGCSVAELRTYLENKFKAGMTWENYGGRTGWQIDHVRELATFDLRDPAQFAAACHYTNLQPLWRAENISKGAHVRWGKNHGQVSLELEQ